MTHRPRKRFGQHFLVDAGIIDRIARSIPLQPERKLVEIGPGRGAITIPLLKRFGALTVIELDRNLIDPLKRKCADAGKLSVMQGDALKTDFCRIAAEQTVRVVGNLPYNISTPLMFHLLEQSRCIEDMHFMLQQEVVNRMAADPGSKRFGRLSVMIQYHCEVIPLFTIPPDAFDPPPKVDSAFVSLKPHDKPPVEISNIAQFEKLVSQAFSRRRKTLRNCLAGLLDEQQIRNCGIDPAVRPEQLSVQDFATLANAASLHDPD